MLVLCLAVNLSCETAILADNSKKIIFSPNRFGEEQIRLMLADRPEMKKMIKDQDPIWKWAVKQFEGESGHNRIYWNNQDLYDKGFEYDSEHHYDTYKKTGFIRLRKLDRFGKPTSTEKLIYFLVFELNNIQSSPKFKAVIQSALKGDMTEDQWIEKNTRIEYEAYRKTIDFYKTVFFPLAKTRHFHLHPFHWGADGPTTYAGWIARYDDRSEYPWSYWGKYYRTVIEPSVKYLKKERETDASLTR